MKKLHQKKRPTRVIVIGVIFCLQFSVLNLWGQSLQQKGYLVDQRAHWVVIVDEPELVRFIAEEMYLTTDVTITRLEIYDLDNNGFSKGDVIKTYPDEIVYHLDDPSERLQSMMNEWEFQANFGRVGENRSITSEYLESTGDAGAAITGSILAGLNRNYQDFPVKIWFVRDSTGFKMEMWGYNEDKLKYKMLPPPPSMPDTVTTYDMLHVFRSDTLVIADTTYYDFLYIYKSVSDTVFLPTGEITVRK